MEESRVISGESSNGVSGKSAGIDVSRPMPKSVRLQATIHNQNQLIGELKNELVVKWSCFDERLGHLEKELRELQLRFEESINKNNKGGDGAIEDLAKKDRQIVAKNRQLKRKDEDIKQLNEELRKSRMVAANWRVRYNKKVTENRKIRENVTEIARHAKNALGVPTPEIKEEVNSSDEGSPLEPVPSTRMGTRSSTRNLNGPPVLHRETTSVKEERKK